MNRTDYLLQRYLRREETEQERIELMELIASGKYRHLVEDEFAEALLNRMPEAGVSVDDFTRHHLQEVRDRLNLSRDGEENTVRTKAAWWFRAAAAVLLLGVCFIAWRYTTPSVQGSDAVAIAQSSSVKASDGITKVILDDGTLVWLKGSSTITYPGAFTGKSRSVVLQGEALFEVAKDPDRPFIIQCGDLKTTVLGTSFNIKTIEDDIEVIVLTGKVALTSTGGNGKSLELLPNEKALYKTGEKQLARVDHVAAEKERMAVLEGTEYNMTFDDTRMVEIIERVENKFNVMVTFSDQELANCRVTADFSDQSLEHTLVLIAQALGIGYEIHGTEIRLVGAGCDDKVSSN